MSEALFRRQAAGLRKLADLAAEPRDKDRLLRTAETFARLAELRKREPEATDEGGRAQEPKAENGSAEAWADAS